MTLTTALAIYLAPSVALLAWFAASESARALRTWLHARHAVWEAKDLTRYSLADDVEDWLRRDANAELLER